MNDTLRIDMYEYVEKLLTDVFDVNVYLMSEPQELTEEDTERGFLVVNIGNLNDASEFIGNTYEWARVFIVAYIPPISRGRVNLERYKTFERLINKLVRESSEDNEKDFWPQYDSLLSTDGEEINNANNVYHTFIKSFIVMSNHVSE